MKHWLLLIFVCTGLCSKAQKYKDTLYSEYKRVYWEDKTEEPKYTNSLFKTAEAVFSVKNPVMRYAIEKSRLGDSAAIALLGHETMGCFLDDKFLSWSCEHFDNDMLPILRVYNDEICGNMTDKMRSYGKIEPEDMPARIEQAVQEGSVLAARNPEFIRKTTELRADHGTDMLMATTANTSQYMYVHCLYIRRYMMQACIDKAMAKYKEHQETEIAAMLENFKSRIVKGSTMGNINEYFTNNGERELAKAYLKEIAQAASDVKADTNTLKQKVSMNNGLLQVAYSYSKENEKEALAMGTLQGRVDWKLGVPVLSAVKYTAGKGTK